MSSQLPSKYLCILAALMLAGCEPPEQSWYYDQDIRQSVFMECLQRAPAGPVSTKYNDWSEVVDECGAQATSISVIGNTYRRAPKVEK
jgi:uncharacterized protein YcfL